VPERRDPPATWLCLRYGKLGPARFTSARDVARLMERAIKRAGLPVAYSSGFSPHQRVSYAYPAPTGGASQAELFLVGLTRLGDAANWANALDAQLPAGVRVEAATLTTDRRYLTGLTASRWRVDWPEGVADAAELRHAVASLLASDAVPIQRRSKSQVSEQDVRPAVFAMEADGASLVAVVKQSEPLIRPVDVWAGLAALSPAVAAWGPGLPTRERQGQLTDDGDVANLI